jgi:hypothetical protein
MIVYNILTRRNDEVDLEGTFSTNELADKFINYYIEKHPDYADKDSHYRDIWIENIIVDERIDKISYPAYKIELDDEDGWECEEVDEESIYGPLAEVWDLDDGDGVIYYWCVCLLDYDGVGKEAIFELGKKMIEDYKKA